MKKILFLLFSMILALPAFCQQDPVISASSGWKFIPEDNMKYAEPAFDDSDWNPIGVDKAWEEQGYTGHDGFAWYRLKVVIPSSLKMNSYLKDSLKIFLGKIDDYDQTYLNGILIGTNGKNNPKGAVPDPAFNRASPIPWDLDRMYSLSVANKAIRWDGENVIAIRVYDQGGPGGIYTGHQEIRMPQLRDYFTIDAKSEEFEFLGNRLTKNFSLNNSSDNLTIKGNLKVFARGKISDKVYYQSDTMITIKPGTQRHIRSIAFKSPDESVVVSFLFRLQDAPGITSAKEESPYILTPEEKRDPRINGAPVSGAWPGHTFLYKIAAAGNRPLTYSAINLPEGLKLDPATGIITGTVTKPGEYSVEISAQNRYGKDTKNRLIKIGETLALTPPMGWNSWNCWGLSVDAKKILECAHYFVTAPLQCHGWSYINIDDGWEIPENREPKRDPNGNILTNEKFPDMKALGDSLHKLGFKFGIYSSPGPLTCGDHTGSYQHEQQDANSYASWGIDYLKYDWCSYESKAKDTTRGEREKPYRIMNEALHKINRDIVFSLCQYGMSNVWEWGDSVGGNLWRTTGDITDSWESMSGIGFSQVQNAPYAGPGHWNDPDMQVLGRVGWGTHHHPTGLTPDEQYTHMSLWCLLSAPLLLGCDYTWLDPFTMNLLTNDEVLAIDQDPRGKQAVPKVKTDELQVWVKELANGHKAIGIFNLSETTLDYTLSPEIAWIGENQGLRDLWRQKGIEKQNGNWVFRVAGHGVVLVASCDL